jgi:hypothetical protein
LAKIVKASQPRRTRAGQRRGAAVAANVVAMRAQANARARRVMPLIRAIRKSGVKTLRGIADALNRKRVATARGGKWHPSTVRSVLLRVA